MSDKNGDTRVKCSICKWALESHCGDLREHECFRNFNDLEEDFVVDDNSFIFIVPKTGEAMLETTQEDLNATDNSLGKLKWTHEAILSLIHTHKSHIQDFNSIKEKKDKVWNRLACELTANGFSYTGNQCKFKFKYLKAKYVQKKDNMKSTSSGQALITFKYFKEMDEIFGKKPDVQPQSLASNLVKRTVFEPSLEEAEEVEEAPDIENNPKKENNVKKQNTNSGNMQRLLNEFKNTSAHREAARERRHTENVI